jgi:hypothetical protein
VHWQLLHVQRTQGCGLLGLVYAQLRKLQALLLRELGQHNGVCRQHLRLAVYLQQLRSLRTKRLRGRLLSL